MAMRRLDQAMVERGLCESREKAKRAIMAGQVRINGQVARKPGDSVRDHDELTLATPEKFVSRGGLKLEHTHDEFELHVARSPTLDIGTSTDGLTDCLCVSGVTHGDSGDVV